MGVCLYMCISGREFGFGQEIVDYMAAVWPWSVLG